jgi:16S rRNA (cytosine967-C5)-methyltransferase
MPAHKPQPTRQVAGALLNRFNPKNQNLKEILPKYLIATDERNILMDVVLGVIRNRELIDTIIENAANVRIERIQKKLLNIIRIGVFELVFTPDRADYAIVDAAVESAKKMGGEKAGAFANALLRNIGRNIRNRSVDLATAEVTKTVIQTIKTGCEFDVSVVPDPIDNPGKYLSVMFSLPLWLVEKWVGEFGFEKSRQICIASNRRPCVYLRPNALKTTPQQLCQLLQNSGIDCKLISERGMIKINHAGDVTKLPGFEDGLFVVQDMTASEAVRMLSPQEGWTVLDMCAAPGGKTTQIAELMNDKGTIFATDTDERRLGKVEENCTRLGIESVRTFSFAKSADVLKDVQCDAVLLDVPCSNTGVLARRPEVRFRIKPKDVEELAQVQLQLLKQAATLVKSGGKICYSTCSIQKQENNDVLQQFLAENKGFVFSGEQLSLPWADDIDCDGGYVAIILKKQAPKQGKRQSKSQN